ncbi:hypothetical protein IX329_002464 [Fusobacterium necrophorum]|nr:hypothetical protein [Fusobacterium necrophorum]MBR8791016.1 hypothetical protein [Fusobacterium necrophorum]
MDLLIKEQEIILIFQEEVQLYPMKEYLYIHLLKREL